MSNYSDWRSDLREVMDDDVDEKKVSEKKVNNNKLIKINPKLGEAVEQLGGQIVEMSEIDDKEDSVDDAEAEKNAKIAEKNKKKEMMLKKRIVRMKMMAVNQGAGDSLVAHHEPEGEMVESAVLDANKKIKKQEQRKKDEKEYARLMAILAHQKDLKKRGLGEEHVDESKGHKGDDSFIEGETGSKTARRNLTRAMSSTRLGMGKPAADTIKRRERHKEDRGVKTKGTKAGHSGSAYPKKEKTLDDTYPHKKEARLKAKLAARKSGEKYVDHTHHSLKKKTVGEKLPKINEEKKDKGRHPRDQKELDRAQAYIKKNPNFGKKDCVDEALGTGYAIGAGFNAVGEIAKAYGASQAAKGAIVGGALSGAGALAGGVLNYAASRNKKKSDVKPKKKAVKEGVMKFVKSIGKKTEKKKPKMDSTTDKLHDWRKKNSPEQKDREKYVSFLRPIEKEEYQIDELKYQIDELNRYGKETGKATGSLNKRPGSSVGKRNEPGSAVNIVRRMIRKDTGRPEGQNKKVKGDKNIRQPGDRRFTPAQTISRMRAQVAAADAAMRDTRGT